MAIAPAAQNEDYPEPSQPGRPNPTPSEVPKFKTLKHPDTPDEMRNVCQAIGVAWAEELMTNHMELLHGYIEARDKHTGTRPFRFKFGAEATVGASHDGPRVKTKAGGTYKIDVSTEDEFEVVGGVPVAIER